MWQGISDARGAATNKVPQLANTFAPNISSKTAKLAVDILSLGLALFLSPCWNKSTFDYAIICLLD